MTVPTPTPAPAPPPAPTALLDRPGPSEAQLAPTGARPAAYGPARLRAHRSSLAVVGMLLVVTGLVQGIGMDATPQRVDDEGTYVAQAWAVLHLHSLTHYTYWYDHPPLGWLQIAGYSWLTDAFGRAPYAVAAGREFMLVVQLVSVVLLWALARRIGMPRWGAAAAVLLFGLSPLAVAFHRMVYLDNISTLWLLAAFVLALSPRRGLTAFAGAGACFAVAVLTKETSLLMLPVLGWVLWRHSDTSTRRYALTVSAAVFSLAAVFYLLFALLKGEVLPGADRTSLWGGIVFQLADRASSGNVFRAGTLGGTTVHQWLRLDLVLPALSLPAAVHGLFIHRMRPVAVAYVVLLAAVVRPGYLPVPFVIGLLPFAALLVAGAAVSGWNAVSSSGPVSSSGRNTSTALTALAALTALTALLVVGFTAPRWYEQDHGLETARSDRPMVQASAWAEANIPHGQRILTDDALWVDLVAHGFSRQDVVWFYKPDTDPAVPAGWRDYSWVISTVSMRTFPTSFDTVRGALQNSTVVAGFGTEGSRVEIRRVLTGGRPDAHTTRALATARAQAGDDLVANPSLTLPAPVAQDLRTGRVDARLLIVLASVSARHTLVVDELPPIDGDSPTPARSVSISRIDAGRVDRASVAALRTELAGQSVRYRPELDLHGSGENARLTITFPVSDTSPRT